jgi:N-sulfoglucosamine sulfohydrolase
VTTNILLITADDMDARTPSSFGGPAGITPNIDRLASEGIRFERAHVVAAVCQPSRSAIMTGLLPHRNGAEGFEPIDDGITLLTEVLRGAGYQSGILGKVDHIQPVERFGWHTRRSMRELGMGRDPEQYRTAAAGFFEEMRQSGSPWFLMANSHDPHRPFHGSAEELEKFSEAERGVIPTPSRVYTAGTEKAPGFLPDIPAVEQEYAEYLSSVRRCDDVVGAVLTALNEAGYAENTLVLFLSDNGMAFPFAKANVYLRSTLTPLIMRWPNAISAGVVDRDSLVSSLDFFPTICEAAGIPVPADLDGDSLTALVTRSEPIGRDTMFTVFHETSGNRRFEMRCAQDTDYGYIWNQWSDGETDYLAENMNGLSWRGIVEAARYDPAIAARASMYLRRAPEELYDLNADPYALDNLIARPELADVVTDYRARMLAWMTQTKDPLVGQFRAVRGTEG